MVEGLSDAAGRQSHRARPALDLNGMLRGDGAREADRAQRSITIGNAIARFEQDKLDEARSRVQALFGEGGEAGAAAAARRRARATRHAAACGGSARPGGEGRTPAGEGRRARTPKTWWTPSKSVNDALAGDDAPLQAAMDALADLLYYLEA